MKKIILASHGSLANGMLSAAKMILVSCDEIEAYDLSRYDNPSEIYKVLFEDISDSPETEYIILCDLNGGSIHNQLFHLCQFRNVYLIAGMTLSMVLEIYLTKNSADTQKNLEEAIQSSIKNTKLLNYDIAYSELKKDLGDEKLW